MCLGSLIFFKNIMHSHIFSLMKKEFLDALFYRSKKKVCSITKFTEMIF